MRKMHLLIQWIVMTALAVGGEKPEWDLSPDKFEVPPTPISGILAGEKFVVGRATWSPRSQTLTLESQAITTRRLPARTLVITFLREDPPVFPMEIKTSSSLANPTIMMEFVRKKNGPMLSHHFMFDYSLYIDISEKTAASYTVKLFVSLPDYQKSVLAGSFEARKAR